MTRYQALRRIGCDPLTAGFISFMNWMRGYPPNRIVFLTVDIELTDGVGPSAPNPQPPASTESPARGGRQG